MKIYKCITFKIGDMHVWMHSINLAYMTLYMYIVLANCAHVILFALHTNDSSCRCFEHGELVCLTMMNLSALSIVAKFLH